MSDDEIIILSSDDETPNNTSAKSVRSAPPSSPDADSPMLSSGPSESDDRDDRDFDPSAERRQRHKGQRRRLRHAVGSVNRHATEGPHSSQPKCELCGQRMCAIVHLVPLEKALSEQEASSDTSLVIQGMDSGDVELPLTEYAFYDERNHLVPLTAGLVEAGKRVYFQGFLKPLDDTSPGSTDNGVPVKRGGPIKEWWTTGYMPGEIPSIGITTKTGNYYLQEPSPPYTPLSKELLDKTTLTKMVFEVLKDFPDFDPEYKECMTRLTTEAANMGLIYFTEETLLQHADYIYDTIQSHDDAATEDEGEQLLINSTFVRELKRYAGLHSRRRALARPPPRNREFNDQPSSTAKPREFSKATTTPLVRFVFESYFKNQMKKDDKKNGAAAEGRERCGTCSACHRPECGKCEACEDMVKFGGSGMTGQDCFQRLCQNLADDIIDVTDLSKNLPKANTRRADISFPSEPVDTVNDSVYYNSVKVNGTTYLLGECVSIEAGYEGTPNFIARIKQIFVEGNSKLAHVQYFAYSNQTVLGETGDKKELFLLDMCEDVLLSDFVHSVDVSFWAIPDNWKTVGGTEESVDPVPINDNPYSFFFRHKYDYEFARFVDVIYDEEFNEDETGQCALCDKIAARTESKIARPVGMAENRDGRSYYKAFKLHGETFRVGDAAFVDPRAFSMPYEMVKPMSANKGKKKVDESTFTEFFRHRISTHVKGSNDLTPDPFRIVVVEEIRGSGSKKRDLTIKVRKIYRVENTHQGATTMYESDFHEVYWSEETLTVNSHFLTGRCYLRPKKLIKGPVLTWTEGGDVRFYFDKVYNLDNKELIPLEESEAGQKALERYKDERKFNNDDGAHPTTKAPLRTLDVFAGCGGLSIGMEQSGLSESKWAIENFPPAAEAFQMNHPDCSVITADCNQVLQDAMDGKDHIMVDGVSKVIPQKGEVDLLCGGPPCQGFSLMNTFSEREYSLFKNSLISSYLSYCDFYRPRFFILENVKNFASYKKCLILKLCIRALTLMGYQCTFGVLQAGNFGVPQTRRRCIIMAAAPGEKLPLYPEPLHAFTTQHSSLNIKLDEKLFSTTARWQDSAPFRTITVRDALTDLPSIRNGEEMTIYGMDAQTHYQRLMRLRAQGNQLYDHECRRLNPLHEARMSLIPVEQGSDWRDLPNIRYELADGSVAEKLVYTHIDHKTKKWIGVCACAESKKRQCSDDKQPGTLIPWALVHTSNRNNHWSGLYGRIDWEGFFSTTVTLPDPNAKQGRVLHPSQHRVVSVRECARSQGFADDVRFAGALLEKHRQIGNAVPPPMAKAIGFEIKKMVQWKENQEAQGKGTQDDEEDIVSID